MPEKIVGLGVSLVICFAAAGLGSLVTAPNIPGWYTQLVKPSWNPPSSVFGPVWTALFGTMAVAAWLVWLDAGSGARIALIAFAAQLVLNIAWSALFFGLHSPRAALIEIAALWLTIALTIAAFASVSRAAAWLLVPYLLWVTFAAYLNYTIVRLNR
ncbi:MAG TPA: TspO/MBR family protein [Candidatus Eremiobacteraceae bacterium]|nr:TspO/MBR family protein [Candidatus Eremiobacteraceae bacterium]